MVQAKPIPTANVNRIVFVNKQSVSQFCTNCLPVAVWHIFFHNSYKFGRFLLGQEITDWNRMTDSAVVFRKPISMGKQPVE